MFKAKVCPKCSFINVQGAACCGRCGEDISKIPISDVEEKPSVIPAERDIPEFSEGEFLSELPQVVIRDIRMSFGAMVAFMVKWALASIPALIILVIIFAIASAIFGGILGGLMR